MRLAVPRGIVYHRLRDDFKWLFQSCYKNLEDVELVHEFENAFACLADRKHCIAFPFARTAIYFALKSQSLPAGSEVIMPPITIKAILDVVILLGLKPVFVDIDPNTLCFDQEKLQEATTVRTRSILVTYLFGMVPDMEKIMNHCHENKLFVIEDFSQCLNGEFNHKKVGSFGHVGVYSASSIKTLDTYGGGLLVCDDDLLEEQFRAAQEQLAPPQRGPLIKKIITDIVRNTATQRLIFHLLVFPLIKLMKALRPGSVLKHTGERSMEMISTLPEDWFTSYTSFQAAIGLESIGSVEKSDQERQRNVEQIKSAAPSIVFPTGVPGGKNVYWQLVAYFADSQKVQDLFHADNLDTATTSLLKISSLSAYPFQGVTPNADRIYSNGLFIPCFPGLGRDVERICNVLNSIDSTL